MNTADAPSKNYGQNETPKRIDETMENQFAKRAEQQGSPVRGSLSQSLRRGAEMSETLLTIDLCECPELPWLPVRAAPRDGGSWGVLGRWRAHVSRHAHARVWVALPVRVRAAAKGPAHALARRTLADAAGSTKPAQADAARRAIAGSALRNVAHAEVVLAADARGSRRTGIDVQRGYATGPAPQGIVIREADQISRRRVVSRSGSIWAAAVRIRKRVSGWKPFSRERPVFAARLPRSTGAAEASGRAYQYRQNSRQHASNVSTKAASRNETGAKGAKEQRKARHG